MNIAEDGKYKVSQLIGRPHPLLNREDKTLPGSSARVRVALAAKSRTASDPQADDDSPAKLARNLRPRNL